MADLLLKIDGVEKSRFYTIKKVGERNGTPIVEISGLGKFTVVNETATIINVMGWMMGYGKENGIMELMVYVSTHTHSEYSILDSINKVSDLAEVSVGAMALTDHGNMCGTFPFQQEMVKRGKKPIIGCEAYMDAGFTSEAGRKKLCHIILLAKNRTGLKNLTELCSRAYDNMYNGRGYITWELLTQYAEGLICTSACVAGEIPRHIANGDMDKAKESALRFKALFGEDFYIEIQHHGFSLELRTNPALIQLAKETGVKLVAGVDAHWLKKGQEEAHEIILAIHDGKKMTGEHRSFEGTDYHVLSQWEAFCKFQNTPEALTSTLEIAQKCSALYETGVYHTPEFNFYPESFSSSVDYFKYLVNEGYKKKIADAGLDSPTYRERLEYEVNTILNMGYADYFLIVAEYVNYSIDNGIAVGPGRGSAAGSLVADCLGITDVDPIKYGLLFERFLNPDRVSMPDIDMDFEDSKRELVIQHIKDLYGESHVANIVTFGQLKGRSAMRDVGNVYDEQFLAGSLSSFIPKNDPKASIKGCLETDADFKRAAENGAEDFLDRCMSVEGLNRNKSTHACGVVIAPDRVSKYIPTFLVGDTKKGYSLATQFVCGEVEEVGLLKMDFLGLKTMGVLNEAVKSAQKEHGAVLRDGVTSYSNIPLIDPYVYRDIAKGSSAIFQIESSGMQSLMKQLYSDVAMKIKRIEQAHKGNNAELKAEMDKFGEELFDRLVAGVAMYRPGPMDFIPDYIEGMNNPSAIKYDVPALEPILKSTYGVIVYQEQVMQIVQALAGFTMAQADMVRKAMGKKKEKLMAEYREYFLHGSGNKVDDHTHQPMNIKGCVACGIPEDIAVKVWDKMKDFAKYAFNKSHACAYAMLSVRCAWLRYYYRTHYMAAMCSVYVDSDNLKGYLVTTKAMGIKILPPDINVSDELFVVEGQDSIRFGLKGIKGLNKSVKDIVAERNGNGKYASLFDVLVRTGINKKSMEALVYSGAVDCFGDTRQSASYMIPVWIEEAKKLKKAKEKVNENQLVFDFAKEEMTSVSCSEVVRLAEMEQGTLLKKEKEYAGLYITAHPLEQYSDVCLHNGYKSLTSYIELDEDGEVISFSQGVSRIAGIITSCRTISTKKDGRRMAFFEIEDERGSIPCVAFPDTYSDYHAHLYEDECVCMTGKFGERNGELQFIADTIVPCSSLPKTASTGTLYVAVSSEEEYRKLEGICKMEAGDTPVYIKYQDKWYKCPVTINPSSKLLMLVEDSFGRGNMNYKL